MSAILQSSPLQLRPMQEEDLDTVLVVERAAYEQPWTRGIFQDCLRIGYSCWVCELGQTLVGHLVMTMAVGEAHILNICIHPDYQGRGMGRELLQKALVLAREQRVDTVFLEVRLSNQVARHLYETEGFNEIGRRHGYYPTEAGREDALVFAKTLQTA